MICANAVPMCWPISALTMCIVVTPSGVMVNQMDGVNPGVAAMAACASPPRRPGGTPMVRNAPPATAAERTRNSRRGPARSGGAALARPLPDLRSPLDGAHDARIRGATAQVAVHAGDDLLLARVRGLCQQRGRLHDLPRLAVPALRDLQLDPGPLHRVGIGGVETFDGGDGGAAHVTERYRAGAHR